ncbi:MAG: hypothetical protein Q8873_04480, partial [Bacillota bacterium]|nr:hypothetical protein [Bacillota bacterium]
LDFEWIFRKTVWGMLFVGLFMDLLQPNSIYKFVYSIILTIFAAVFLIILHDVKKHPNKYKYTIYLLGALCTLWFIYVIFGLWIQQYELNPFIIAMVIITTMVCYEVGALIWCLLLSHAKNKDRYKIKRNFDIFIGIPSGIIGLAIVLVSVSIDNYAIMLYLLMTIFIAVFYHSLRRYIFTRVYRAEIEADIPPKRTVKRKKKSQPEENEQKE